MYRVYPTAVLLIIASLPVISVCQTDCAYPTTSDLENVIVDVIMAADSAATPIVTVTDFHPVCLAHGQERDRYHFLSLVVEYTCSNNGNCPSGSGSAVEQFETECDRGVWDYQVLSHVEYTRTRSPTASFSTTAREDCAFCSSPELISSSSLPHVTDNLTHCVGKSITPNIVTIYYMYVFFL